MLAGSNRVLISGPMFAGKSSKGIDIASQFKNVIFINHVFDTRYGTGVISTHNKQQVRCFMCNSAEEIINIYNKFIPEMLVIDEIQFFPQTILSDLESIPCMIYFLGLDKDFRRIDFATTAAIAKNIPLENQVLLTALCACKKIARYTKLTTAEEVQGNILIGTDKYCAVCNDCY